MASPDPPNGVQLPATPERTPRGTRLLARQTNPGEVSLGDPAGSDAASYVQVGFEGRVSTVVSVAMAGSEAPSSPVMIASPRGASSSFLLQHQQQLRQQQVMQDQTVQAGAGTAAQQPLIDLNISGVQPPLGNPAPSAPLASEDFVVAGRSSENEGNTGAPVGAQQPQQGDHQLPPRGISAIPPRCPCHTCANVDSIRAARSASDTIRGPPTGSRMRTAEDSAREAEHRTGPEDSRWRRKPFNSGNARRT